VSKKIPQLDGIRGLAILLVILHNESREFPSLHLERLFANGWMGVDLFFVLSGFLITGILLDTEPSQGYFANFYARRCLRIWPLYYSVILVMFVVMPHLIPSQAHLVLERSSPWWAYPLFLQNFLIPIPTNGAGPLGVTWSLAIEEQFYLVWPWIVRYCSREQLRRLTGAAICLSPVLRFALSYHRDIDLYTNVFCRLDGLMAGAFLALSVRSNSLPSTRSTKPAWICLFTAAPLAFITEAAHARWIVYSLSAAASASLVYLALFSSQKWLRLALTNRFMVFTGTISYGLYLLHKIPFDLAKALHVNQAPGLMLVLTLSSCYVVATLSWTLLEKPSLGLKRFFATKPALADPSKRPFALALR
jgi:peptidoglycan/LPS O-acetylase OafA/YrhL